MNDNFSEETTSALERFSELRRRYRTEAPDALVAPLQDARGLDFPELLDEEEEIPLLTEAVLIAETQLPAELPVNPIKPEQTRDAALIDSLDDELTQRLVERLRPVIAQVVRDEVQALLGAEPKILYERWLVGLRQRVQDELLRSTPQDNDAGEP